MARELKRKLGGPSQVAEPKNGKKRQRTSMDVDEDSEQLSTHDVEAPDDLDDKASSEEEINVSEVEEVVGAEAPQASYGNTKSKKPPTGEELRTIKEASDLYKSNTFKLQIDALLPNVRPKQSHTPPLDRFLITLHTYIMSLSPSPPQHPLEASRALRAKGVAVPYPYPAPTEETNWKVAFEKPSEITLVGSWANKTSVKGKDGASWGVDVAVEMPVTMFQEKDYLNARFFHKKAFYLASLASAITKSKTGLDVDVLYESSYGDSRLTTLILRPKEDGAFKKLNAYIRIIPTLSPLSPIALQRLSPAHSNIRLNGTITIASSPPTPMYNTALLTSLTPRPHLLHTHETINQVPSFRDALTLLRVWANQRGYCASSGSRGCVAGFEGRGAWWSALLSVLIVGQEREPGAGKKGQRKPLGRGLSSYQLFRAALDFMSRHDFEKEMVFVRSKDGHRFPPEEYKSHHEAVFVDSSSTINLLAGVPLSSLDLLQHDARVTLNVLDNSLSSIDPFSDVFLADKRDLLTRFDVVLRVNMADAKLRDPALHSAFDYGSPTTSLLHSLCSTLRQALTNRTKAIAILSSVSLARPLSQTDPSPPSSSYLHIGLVIDPTEALRLVDRGPSAADTDANASLRFRELWGSKAELRRFKDGRIEESVVWDVKNSDERARIPAMIVRHILERHFGLNGDRDVQGWQAEFDSALRIPETITNIVSFEGTQTGFKGSMIAFDALVKQIKALDDELPLALLNVSPVSGHLRYTNVFAPIPLAVQSIAALPLCASHIPAMEIVLQFERSARWPDDLAAIQKMKLAFFERIASALMTNVPGLKASVVVGDGISTSDIVDQAKLEILTAQGWAFSARIWHDREATLLERLMGNKNIVIKSVAPKPEDGGERRRAFEAFQVYTRRFIHAPKHHRAIAALCHRFPAYAGTVRLVKRWLASHWVLGGHINEEAVELLCASVFVRDGKIVAASDGREDTVGVPGSKELGFARVVAFLKDWQMEEGLFVPIYGDLQSEDAEKQEGKSVHVRAGTVAGVWTISTEVDREGRIWTTQGPAVLAARRVKMLAKATWDCMQGLERGGLNSAKALFIHPTEDYDFLIHLEPSVLCRYYQNVNADASVWTQRPKYANLPASTENGSEAGRVGFDPGRMFYDDLKRTYAGTMELFFDPLGGAVIGAVWDPSVKEARPFRVLAGYSSIPLQPLSDEKSKTKNLVGLNEASIISEIKRLGEGLVKSVEILRSAS